MIKKGLLLFAVFGLLGISRVVLSSIHNASFLLANKIVNSSIESNNVALAEEFSGSSIRDGSIKSMDSFAMNTPSDTAVATTMPTDSKTKQIEPTNSNVARRTSILSTVSTVPYTRPNTSI